jgi:hypothetical protein
MRLLICSGGRWHQLVVTCLAFTSSIKSRGHSPAHTCSKGFEPGLVLWCLKHFISWISAVWRLSEHAEGIYIPPIVYIYFIYFLIDFDWKRETHLGEASS